MGCKSVDKDTVPKTVIGISNANNLEISKRFKMINLSIIEDQYFIDMSTFPDFAL